VRVGPEANGRTVVLEGLAAGQRVVASGQFLIDSEASLKGLEARLAPAAAAPAAPSPLIEARGRVAAVDDGMITVAHEPIAALGWPEMTMPFRLEQPELAAALHAGDSIRFALRQKDDEYRIVTLERTGGAP
jgi:Cu(I)/Ag(I) efflux system membrane fusion protein